MDKNGGGRLKCGSGNIDTVLHWWKMQEYRNIGSKRRCITCLFLSLRPGVKNKKLSYCWETVRRESMPRIAEMDVEMTTWAEVTFKCTSRSSKVAPIKS